MCVALYVFLHTHTHTRTSHTLSCSQTHLQILCSTSFDLAVRKLCMLHVRDVASPVTPIHTVLCSAGQRQRIHTHNTHTHKYTHKYTRHRLFRRAHDTCILTHQPRIHAHAHAHVCTHSHSLAQTHTHSYEGVFQSTISRGSY